MFTEGYWPSFGFPVAITLFVASYVVTFSRTVSPVGRIFSILLIVGI
jgi:hypothetical protein